jgi:hypothetical protein
VVSASASRAKVPAVEINRDTIALLVSGSSNGAGGLGEERLGLRSDSQDRGPAH